MALFWHPTPFCQRGTADYGRCGLSSDYNPSSISTAESVSHAGQRLLAAAALGDCMQAMRCVADGADPNFSDPSTGETALHRAAHHNQVAVVEMLASVGADMDRPNLAGHTSLYTAASGGFLDTVTKLLFHGAALFPEPRHPPYASCRDAADTRHPCSSSSSPAAAAASLPSNGHNSTTNNNNADDNEAALLLLRSTCPLAAAAAAASWPLVAALLAALPPDCTSHPRALRSLRFLVWALASHKAFPREVISRLPPRLPRCVLDAVRPAHLASTPLVLATGHDQQQLMQWLLQRGADPELGAPLLLCAGRFCRGSRTCCVSTLLRRGAAPNVAWADTPADSPLALAAAGDCFSHVHVLVAYGADVGGEVARVRGALFAPAAWEAHLDALVAQRSGGLAAAAGAPPRAELLCPCGLERARWPGLWPQEGESEAAGAAEAGASGNSCYNQTPADDAWYRGHCAEMEQLQDGPELAECRKAVDELWQYGCAAVVSELGGAPSSPYSLLPQRVLAAMQDVADGWLAAAVRCRSQRLLRADLYDKAVAAGRALLDRKRVAALAALSGTGWGTGEAGDGGEEDEAAGPSGAGSTEGAQQPQQQPQQPQQRCSRGVSEGLVKELRMEVLAMAGLAPPGVEARVLSPPTRAPCCCQGCRSSQSGLDD